MVQEAESRASIRLAMSQAAAWFARQRCGSWSDTDAADFAAWLKADPTHTSAWSSYEQLWGNLDNVRGDPRILEIREQAKLRAARAGRRRWVWRSGGALAASTLLFLLLRGSLNSTLLPHPRLQTPYAAAVRDASTDIGERSLLVLADGSKVTLNTASAVHVDFRGQERRVSLVRGEAYFEVAKDRTRPFIVSAGLRQVIAIGTAFDVRFQDRAVKVTLVEGKVRILPTAQRDNPGAADSAVTLEAGSALVWRQNGAEQIESVDTSKATSWRSGKLVFESERLADVVAEMNRYSREQLEIDDPVLRERRVSGVFEPAGAAGFARALEDYGIARASRRTPNTLVLDRLQ